MYLSYLGPSEDNKALGEVIFDCQEGISSADQRELETICRPKISAKIDDDFYFTNPYASSKNHLLEMRLARLDLENSKCHTLNRYYRVSHYDCRYEMRYNSYLDINYFPQFWVKLIGQ
ncbi:MAG: hypothetical protein AABZ06_15430 [Bdellovibrionota bacterium]